MKKLFWIALACGGAWFTIAQQNPDFSGVVSKSGQRPHIAIPELHGSDAAQALMGGFNQTLLADIQNSGVLLTVPRTMYPKTVPQQPSDFRLPPPPPEPSPRSRRQPPPAVPANGGGLWMSDWSSPPVSADYLAFGYTAVQNGVLVLFGNLFDLSRGTPANAQVISKRYLATTADEAGARQVAHQFAADILAIFGSSSLFGTHIYYIHQTSSGASRTTELWAMEPDGGNAHAITHFNSLTIEPAISPDESRLAFTSYVHGNPGIFVFSVDPVRDLRFYNQVASVNAQPSFTPDGKQMVYSSSAGHCCRIYIANLDGSGFRPITSSSFIDTEPKVNPKTGATILFSSGRSGPEQIYIMDTSGGNIERVSDGTGEASNPSWHPDGQLMAFAWTRGYAMGKFNVFVMDVASRKYTQLTHDEGKNENPAWAPDGKHLAFMSNRNGREQIWTMLADGTQAQQITRDGLNYSPVWGK